MDIPLLTPEQIEFFHREGYVLPIKVLDDATLQALREEEDRFRHGPNPLSGTFDVEGTTSLFRSQVTNYSAPVREFGTRGPHLPIDTATHRARYLFVVHAVRDQVARR
jgi:hypothetical protein